MPIINQAFRTVTCDGPGCENTVTFDASNQGVPPDTFEKAPWLKTNRAIQTADGRVFSYCSDVCEVKGIETSEHNAPEEKHIAPVTGGGAAAIAAEAAAARRKKITEEKLKKGEPVKVSLA